MNLYAHFPFCRRKCRYCALFSRSGEPQSVRDAYARHLASFLSRLPEDLDGVEALVRSLRLEDKRQTTNDKGLDAVSSAFSTVYFGGGTPALCDLRPVLDALAPRLVPDAEFTVELHPLDVSDDFLSRLRDGGVNRVSMGVQSLDDATLASMGRGYDVATAARAFARIRRFFDNAGVDLIVGYPGDPCADYSALADWGLRHCSVYSLQNERGLADVPDDDWTLDRVRDAAAELEEAGLERYEISNYAVPGFECRHNLAVWRGEDYLGLGAGAYGRLGRLRTKSLGAPPPTRTEVEELSPERDATERRIFALRTRDGLDAAKIPADWLPVLERHRADGLLALEGGAYRLTPRGAEVCDSMLVDLV